MRMKVTAEREKAGQGIHIHERERLCTSKLRQSVTGYVQGGGEMKGKKHKVVLSATRVKTHTVRVKGMSADQHIT